jgi:hypothetical protein
MNGQQGQQPQAQPAQPQLPQAQPSAPPGGPARAGSKESFDALVSSLEYSFMDIPELMDEDGTIHVDQRTPPSYNPFLQQNQQR